MTRYLRLLGVQVRQAMLLAVQYRLDFVVEAVLSVFWIAASLVPLMVLFGRRPSVAGWTWPEALVVVAWFTCLKGLLDGFVQPSLQAVVEHIRKGTLDFLLIKPVDAQFMLSTAKMDLGKIAEVVAGIVILVYALGALGHVPSAAAVAKTVALLGGASLMLYAIWVLVTSLAFQFVKVDNLSFLFMSIYDAARWPGAVFRGALSFVFTFVIPLVVMTTYPALAILDRLETWRVAVALGGAVALSTVARLAWLRAIRHYTSAGG